MANENVIDSEVSEPEIKNDKKTIKEMILYKMDRTFAVVGIIILGAWALTKTAPDAYQITMAAIGGLVGYIGGRTGK